MISSILSDASASVAPREGRVSRNYATPNNGRYRMVAPREGRVSRNGKQYLGQHEPEGRAPRGACE